MDAKGEDTKTFLEQKIFSLFTVKFEMRVSAPLKNMCIGRYITRQNIFVYF